MKTPIDHPPKSTIQREAPRMSFLSSELAKTVSEGYTTGFKVEGPQLLSPGTLQHFAASQVQVVDYFCYEGVSDPEDNFILYVIETNDGTKGTLMNSYGYHSDKALGAFMLTVNRIKKNENKNFASS